MNNPYKNLPPESYWKSGVTEVPPTELSRIYKKKFEITEKCKVATAGSCFAQHIGKHLRVNGFNVLDVEPAPSGLVMESHSKYGYSMYSARYGNVYTVQQLLQLACEVSGDSCSQNIVWERDGRFYDALRPAIEPAGLESEYEVLAHRQYHIERVRRLFEEMDVFIFTLGLTEAWLDKRDGTVYPTAPGVIAGSFDETIYRFHNYDFNEIVSSFLMFKDIVRQMRTTKPPPKYLLTVSPVPLVATGTNNHVLSATTYSKSVLRAAAGFMADNNVDTDYFPSYEIITNQAARGLFYNDNLRTVTSDGVATVMRSFFIEHKLFSDDQCYQLAESQNNYASQIIYDDIQCEEALLGAFANEYLDESPTCTIHQ